MRDLGAYDASLQMFVQEPRDADASHLRFLRWLAERGGLEHGVAGPPGGSYSKADRSGHEDRGESWARAA